MNWDHFWPSLVASLPALLTAAAAWLQGRRNQKEVKQSATEVKQVVASDAVQTKLVSQRMEGIRQKLAELTSLLELNGFCKWVKDQEEKSQERPPGTSPPATGG